MKLTWGECDCCGKEGWLTFMEHNLATGHPPSDTSACANCGGFDPNDYGDDKQMHSVAVVPIDESGFGCGAAIHTDNFVREATESQAQIARINIISYIESIDYYWGRCREYGRILGSLPGHEIDAELMLSAVRLKAQRVIKEIDELYEEIQAKRLCDEVRNRVDLRLVK